MGLFDALSGAGSGAAAGSAFGPWGTAIGAGVGLLGGLMGKSAANKAAKAQQAAADQARQVLATETGPYRQFGLNAMTDLSALLGLNGQAPEYDLSNNPAYQFNLREGLKGLDSTAAARGNLLSGAQMKAAQGYASGLASQEYDKVAGRLMAALGIGQQASRDYAGGASDLLTGAGQARAAGIVGGANALSSGVQGGINNATLWSLLNSSAPPAAPAAAGGGSYNWGGAALPASGGPVNITWR